MVKKCFWWLLHPKNSSYASIQIRSPNIISTRLHKEVILISKQHGFMAWASQKEYCHSTWTRHSSTKLNLVCYGRGLGAVTIIKTLSRCIMALRSRPFRSNRMHDSLFSWIYENTNHNFPSKPSFKHSQASIKKKISKIVQKLLQKWDEFFACFVLWYACIPKMTDETFPLLCLMLQS